MSKVADTEQPRKLSLEMPDYSTYVAGEDDETDIPTVYKHSFNHYDEEVDDALATPAALPPDYNISDCARALAGMSRFDTPDAPITKERRDSNERIKFVDEIVSDVLTKMLEGTNDNNANDNPRVDYQEDVDEDVEDVDDDDEDVDDLDDMPELE